jgi:leucine dehydrogenase
MYHRRRSRVNLGSRCEMALGGTLNSATILRLKARVVAGGANNQFQSASDGDTLHRRGIMYAPDYVANAAGVQTQVNYAGQIQVYYA